MHIQVFEPRIHALFAEDGQIEQVISGFQFLEGPIWRPQEQSLIFSDILGNSIYHWSAKDRRKDPAPQQLYGQRQHLRLDG